jgi:hypothetical protein
MLIADTLSRAYLLTGRGNENDNIAAFKLAVVGPVS